ncbi:hypothetical protein BD414DRAFT_498326 [Trametes punicea]|nr:hypothetical protein BD414DRAFT_498326 [Trametes punicea]
MRMSLFSGQAWFSPRVPVSIRKAWIINGGAIAGPRPDATQAMYVFCDGRDDPWFRKLYQRSIAVFHWLWISAVVNARFRVPISAYAIDDAPVIDTENSSLPPYTHCSAVNDILKGTEASKGITETHSNASTVSHSSKRHGHQLASRMATSRGRRSESLRPLSESEKALPFLDLRSMETNRKTSVRGRLKVVRPTWCERHVPDTSGHTYVRCAFDSSTTHS